MREIASSFAAVPPMATALYLIDQPCSDRASWSNGTATKPSIYTALRSISATPRTGYTGRYTQSDPIGFDGNDLNLFRYALDNPVGVIDPLGLDVRVCCRDFNFPGLSKAFDHCYVESNAGGSRRTWGLYGRETKATIKRGVQNPSARPHRRA